MKNFLYILSGASGSGKTVLYNKMITELGFLPVPKYSNRAKISMNDDIIPIETNETVNFDSPNYLHYEMYLNNYYIDYSSFIKNVHKHNLVVIISHIPTILWLKSKHNNIKTIYISSNINTFSYLGLYLKRHHIELLSEQNTIIIEKLDKCRNNLTNNKSAEFFNEYIAIFYELQKIIPDYNAYYKRLLSIESSRENYIKNISAYDNVIFDEIIDNEKYSDDNLFNQIKQIIEINKKEGK